MNQPAGHRVTVNISNCTSGGGLQIGVWFVRRLLRSPPEDLRLSLVVHRKHLSMLPAPLPQDVLVVDASPMRSFAARRQVQEFLSSRNTDCLFSVFGPSGLAHSNQISGVANAFITSLSPAVIRLAHRWTWPAHYLRYYLYGRMLTACRRLVFETVTERDRYVARFRYPLAQTTVIPNSVDEAFLTAERAPVARPSFIEHPRLLFVTSTHRHKNNLMIPSYVQALRQRGFEDFTLALTLTADNAEGLHGGAAFADSHVELLGILKPADLLREYQRCHVVVQASSLETYSAVYNEVRLIPRALLASDRPFAREICGSFARFFEPLDPESFASAVNETGQNLDLAEAASAAASREVMPPDQKFQAMLALIREAVA